MFRVLTLLAILNVPFAGPGQASCWAMSLGQATTLPPLTLSQIKDLLSIAVPDATIAGELQARGVSFEVDERIIAEVSSLGAGSHTLEALRALRASGVLIVTTRGAGDRVLLDSSLLGITEANGRLRATVSAGAHEISVKRIGVADVPSVRRNIQRGGEASVEFTFEIPPVRVGGNIKPPAKLKHVEAIYPPEARAARRQGVVLLELVLNADGTVRTATALRPIPMLTEAAIEAAKQWVFEPTRLNGVAVPAIMTAPVMFTLQ